MKRWRISFKVDRTQQPYIVRLRHSPGHGRGRGLLKFWSIINLPLFSANPPQHVYHYVFRSTTHTWYSCWRLSIILVKAVPVPLFPTTLLPCYFQFRYFASSNIIHIRSKTPQFLSTSTYSHPRHFQFFIYIFLNRELYNSNAVRVSSDSYSFPSPCIPPFSSNNLYNKFWVPCRCFYWRQIVSGSVRIPCCLDVDDVNRTSTCHRFTTASFSAPF